MMNQIRMKRIYEASAEEDGFRILVDRLWPRGVSKEQANLDRWAKSIAPSTALRKEFNHQPSFMEEFQHKYLLELDHNKEATAFVDLVRHMLADRNVTLLFAAKDRNINHVVILKEWLDDHLKNHLAN